MRKTEEQINKLKDVMALLRTPSIITGANYGKGGSENQNVLEAITKANKIEISTNNSNVQGLSGIATNVVIERKKANLQGQEVDNSNGLGI